MGSSYGVAVLLVPFGILTFLYFLLISVNVTDGLFKDCKYPEILFNPESEVQKYGKPTAFVSTSSIGISPYSLVDPYRQSSLFHEYLLVGPGKANADPTLLEYPEEFENAEEIQLVVYDYEGTHFWDNEPNLVQHNLGKEYNWALINATGMLPSLTMINTTFEKTFRFHADEGDTISYHMTYPHLFRNRVTTPPVDVLIEFPAKTRTLLTVKTMIDYQGFGLLRWRLTPARPVLWRDIKRWEFARPNIYGDECMENDDPIDVNSNATYKDDHKADEYTDKLSNKFLLCIYQRRFFRIENPCVKDMFLWYVLRGQRGVPEDPKSYKSAVKLFIVIPMVYDVLQHEGWYDMTDVYCSRPDDPEECADPLSVVLTNDHLLIHTDKGLYVSGSLNQSNVNVSFPYSMKPLLKFTPIDPCSNYDYFNCSEIGAPTLARQAIRRQRLFYTPVCHRFQYPFYEDIVILVIEYLTVSPDMSEEWDAVTILYAKRPYYNWKMLFHEQHLYNTKEGRIPIKEVIGVFFNHHRRHFDISFLLNDNGRERTIRFVLPEPTEEDFHGYTELSGLLGNGFLEFEFPSSFHMTNFVVNPEVLDIFYLGDQLWIAEAGGAFVYLSVPHLRNHNLEPSYFDTCSFNHPDRTFVCTEKTHAEIFVGRVGVTYAPIGVDYKKINEFKYVMLYNQWPFKYRQYITLLGHFIAGYSGKVMLWYLYDHNQLVREQFHLSKVANDRTQCTDPEKDDHAVKCHICKRMHDREKVYNCKITSIPDEDNDPRFRMIGFDTSNLQVRASSTDGPLVPYIIDGDKAVIFEAEVPQFKEFKPDYSYLHDTNVGNRVICPTPIRQLSETDGENTDDGEVGEVYAGSQCPEVSTREAAPACEVYIRHLRQLTVNGKAEFLAGIRRSLYVLTIKSFPLTPVPTAVVVLILKNSNMAIIQLDTSPFKEGKEYLFGYEHVGQTLYIPEHMSILLAGFPEYEVCTGGRNGSTHKMSRMTGYSTRYNRLGTRLQIAPFKSFLINFSTIQYCMQYQKSLEALSDDCEKKDLLATQNELRKKNADIGRTKVNQQHSILIDTINREWETMYTSTSDEDGGPLLHPATPVNSSYSELEEKALEVQHNENNTLESIKSSPSQKLELNITERPTLQNFKCPSNVIWQIVDGGCHLQLYLNKNPVIKQNGGRIDLDKYDSISYTVKLRSVTALGKSLIHRPLMSVTNTNPDILTVEKQEVSAVDPQVMRITLTPTGLRRGVATVTIRPLIVSTHCPFSDGSFSLVILIRRALGRRLHVNYPIPKCKPETDVGEYLRPWKVDLPTCVRRTELLTKDVIRRPDDKYGQIFYQSLPFNYRPPSAHGTEIPTSPNVYNVDPQKPNFKDWYQVSKLSGDLDQCLGRMTRDQCSCTDNDELSDDPLYTDCKRMVYVVRRSVRVDISVEYDRLMNDADQHTEFFSSKSNWTVYVEEINNRTEFTLNSASNLYLTTINEHDNLHQGYKYYDARTLGVTLHGTGLFHFSVSLGEFETFDQVTSHFILFCAESETNHVQLVVIMLLTITVCMLLVFLGFIIVKSRLSSYLPFQISTKSKIKGE